MIIVTSAQDIRRAKPKPITGQRLENDYAERGNENYFMIICALTGFVRACKTANKSTSETLKGLRA